MSFSSKSRVAVLATAAVMSAASLPALAVDSTLQGGVTKTKVSSSVSSTSSTSNQNKTFLQKHPVVKKAAIGAGLGTAAGALTGAISGKGTLRGAAIGAATGTSIGLVKSSKTLKNHPVVSNTATGTAIGLGLGLAATRGGSGHSKVKRLGTAAGVGAAIGAATGLLKNEFE